MNKPYAVLRARSLFAPIALVALAFALADCSGTDTTTTPASGTFGHVYASLRSSCVGCHVPGGAPSTAGVTIDFTTQATAYTTLTQGVASGQSSSVCSGLPLVKAGFATTSYLSGVLFSDIYKSNNFADKSGCAPYNAHLTDQVIKDSEKTSILAWINGGALNN